MIVISDIEALVDKSGKESKDRDMQNLVHKHLISQAQGFDNGFL